MVIVDIEGVWITVGHWMESMQVRVFHVGIVNIPTNANGKIGRPALVPVLTTGP